jgi:hypothetical protein
MQGFFPSIVTLTLTQLLQHSNVHVGGSFIATIFETAAVAMIYMAWRSIMDGVFRFVLGCMLVLNVVAFCVILMPFCRFEHVFMGWRWEDGSFGVVACLHEKRFYLVSTMMVLGHWSFQHVLGGHFLLRSPVINIWLYSSLSLASTLSSRWMLIQ